MTTMALLSGARGQLHEALVDSGVLSRDANGVASFADASSRTSVALAKGILARLPGGHAPRPKSSGQSMGGRFEECCADFLRATFLSLAHLRPGQWRVERADAQGIARFEQYLHLARLEALAQQHHDLAAALGTDYIIKPDVLVSRAPEPDASINAHAAVVDDQTALAASLRSRNNSEPILHASVSTKWTLRSDRAQNARTEALNLLRNRKGRVPHIVVITAEPLPSRLASLALGTGDIDCVYHVFLHELQAALEEEVAARSHCEDAQEMLRTMVEGHRLRDIADLPLDLAV
jgi:hypothetical protein